MKVFGTKSSCLCWIFELGFNWSHSIQHHPIIIATSISSVKFHRWRVWTADPYASIWSKSALWSPLSEVKKSIPPSQIDRMHPTKNVLSPFERTRYEKWGVWDVINQSGSFFLTEREEGTSEEIMQICFKISICRLLIRS